MDQPDRLWTPPQCSVRDILVLTTVLAVWLAAVLARGAAVGVVIAAVVTVVSPFSDNLARYIRRSGYWLLRREQGVAAGPSHR